MHTVGDSSFIICPLTSLSGYAMYTWYNEDGNTVVNGDRLSYTANDSIHHKLFTCSGRVLTSDTVDIRIKIVINGNDICVIITL